MYQWVLKKQLRKFTLAPRVTQVNHPRTAVKLRSSLGTPVAVLHYIGLHRLQPSAVDFLWLAAGWFTTMDSEISEKRGRIGPVSTKTIHQSYDYKWSFYWSIDQDIWVHNNQQKNQQSCLLSNVSVASLTMSAWLHIVMIRLSAGQWHSR